MNTERAQVGWGFWLWWVLASTVGLAVGWAVGGAVGGAVGVDGDVGWAVRVVVVGASIGIAQWLVLRRQVSRPGWWVLASTVGLAVGFAVGEAVGGAVGGNVGWAVRGVVVGAAVGTAQWLVLRRQVSRAGWWVLASTVGLAVGLAVGWAVGAVGWAVGFAVYGAITGGALVWLLQQPSREA